MWSLQHREKRRRQEEEEAEDGEGEEEGSGEDTEGINEKEETKEENVKKETEEKASGEQAVEAEKSRVSPQKQGQKRKQRSVQSSLEDTWRSVQVQERGEGRDFAEDWDAPPRQLRFDLGALRAAMALDVPESPEMDLSPRLVGLAEAQWTSRKEEEEQLAAEDGAFYVMVAPCLGPPPAFGPSHQLYLFNHRRAEESAQFQRLVTTVALPASDLDEPLWLEQACDFLEPELRQGFLRMLRRARPDVELDDGKKVGQDSEIAIGTPEAANGPVVGLEEALRLNGFALGRDRLRGFFLKAVPQDGELTIDHFVETIQLLLATATPDGPWGVERAHYRLYRPPALLRLLVAQSERLGQAAGERASQQRVDHVLAHLWEENEDVLSLKCPHNLPLFARLPDPMLLEATELEL
jgi:hypothetical protein